MRALVFEAAAINVANIEKAQRRAPTAMCSDESEQFVDDKRIIMTEFWFI